MSRSVVGAADLAFHEPAGKPARLQVAAALTRPRLHDALDEARKRPAVWIAAPPGAGKSTLISTYLDQKNLRSLWYRFQEDEADPATLFSRLGAIVEASLPPGQCADLPALPADSLTDLALFSRRYFKHLHRLIGGPWNLVLDGCVQLEQGQPLCEIVRLLIESLPQGANLIVLSRYEPPAVFAALRVRGAMTVLDGDRLKLTAEECGAFAELRGTPFDPLALQHLYDQTEGWVAGVVLALELGPKILAGGEEVLPTEMMPQVVFDYFAGEIFEHMVGDVQEVLLRVALLPGVTETHAVELSARSDAGKILEELVRSNYFTSKVGPTSAQAPGTFRFHPLFREFLLRRAGETLSPGVLSQLRCQAAGVLEASGRLSEAVALLIEAQAWQATLEVVRAHAVKMLRQGRGSELEGWLRALPASFLDQSPWALYWLGKCRLASDPGLARDNFEQAFGLFERSNDIPGVFSSWASIVHTFVFALAEFTSLDRWIAVLDRLVACELEPPSQEIEAHVAFGMFTALMYRRPDRADLPRWAEQVRAFAVSTPDVCMRMIFANQLMIYYSVWVGDMAATQLLVDAVQRPVSAAECGPLGHIAWCGLEAEYHWQTGAFEDCLRRANDGLEIARHSGARFASARLEALAVMASLKLGDSSGAAKLLERASGTAENGRLAYRAHYHFLVSLSCISTKDSLRAEANARAALSLADAAGFPLLQALHGVGLARALFGRGEKRKAMGCLARARRMARGSCIPTVEFICLSTTIEFLMERCQQGRGLNVLSKALHVARRRGLVNHLFWTPELMTRVFAIALTHGVEVDFVHESIHRHKLAPPLDASRLEQWPYPVKIYTLGRFAMLIDGKELQFSGKVQRKPLELLMALIAFGGRDVSERQLTEALWPDAEGDSAHQSCAVTLHRLRKLLGREDAITLQGNLFSLDARLVWVDVWAFDAWLTMDRDSSSGSRSEVVGKVTSLYRGSFLEKQYDLICAIPLRERLRAKFRRFLVERCDCLIAGGQCAEAIELLESGLNVEPLAEEFYRDLMTCYRNLGRKAEALATYQRCERTLGATSCLPPAPKTVALYQALRA